jgi:dephospho-CoA kinase
LGRALRLGITGKIGSGKSTLAAILRNKNIPVIDTDALAKELMNSKPEFRNAITQLFGDSAYTNNELNRSFIASIIFKDTVKKLKLEELVHPAVSEVMEDAFTQAKEGEIVGVESALIFQTELWQRFDYIVLVTSNDATILNRTAEQGKNLEDTRNRLLEQNYNPRCREEADFVLENEGSLKEFTSRCEFLSAVISSLVSRTLPDDPLHSLELEDLSQGNN